MKIITTILIILFTLSCNSEQECEIIRDKDEVNGNYYFYFRSNFLPNSQVIILEELVLLLNMHPEEGF